MATATRRILQRNRCALSSWLARGLAFSALFVRAGIAWPVGATSLDWLQRGFAEPPDSAKPRVWWDWINGNVTKGVKLD